MDLTEYNWTVLHTHTRILSMTKCSNSEKFKVVVCLHTWNIITYFWISNICVIYLWHRFQKNSTAYNPNFIAGRYKALRKINTEWKIDGEDKSPGYLDNCFKKKICETIKSNYSRSQLETLQQNYKLK